MDHELQRFFESWDYEAQQTLKLLRALPEGKYDFRPVPEWRSLGELAWHLAEVDTFPTMGIEKKRFILSDKPPGIERPRTIAELAPGFERLHREAVARVRKVNLTDADLETKYPFYDASPLTLGEILWNGLLFHLIHHRGQLVLMTRLAGGTPPGIYGPNREEMARIMEENKSRN